MTTEHFLAETYFFFQLDCHKQKKDKAAKQPDTERCFFFMTTVSDVLVTQHLVATLCRMPEQLCQMDNVGMEPSYQSA